MKKKLHYVRILISVIVFVVLYFKLKLPTKKERKAACNEYYDNKINSKICKAYYGRASIIVELCNGKKISWKCEKKKFAQYRNNLNSLYSNRAGIEQFERIDSLFKPPNSFDFYLYINSNPDSLMVLECDYDCNVILKDK